MQENQWTRRDSSASEALSEDAGIPSHSAVLMCGKKLKVTLQYIHARGYGHSNVKGANIFSR